MGKGRFEGNQRKNLNLGFENTHLISDTVVQPALFLFYIHLDPHLLLPWLGPPTQEDRLMADDLDGGLVDVTQNALADMDIGLEWYTLAQEATAKGMWQDLGIAKGID